MFISCFKEIYVIEIRHQMRKYLETRKTNITLISNFIFKYAHLYQNIMY